MVNDIYLCDKLTKCKTELNIKMTLQAGKKKSVENKKYTGNFLPAYYP